MTCISSGRKWPLPALTDSNSAPEPKELEMIYFLKEGPFVKIGYTDSQRMAVSHDGTCIVA